ncbi:isochorismatase family protein [Uruburuella testudinis]|uniref:nicotinamidase n=1 Tax=Uruburuella testudinis TaxID=1282863 RepID=A0ABY4DUR3_9NEIS|nr:isochorismatase family protein [Uruburuella testudinis]UOO82454.1 isochorismatase family protein [Uruburuella testudinis]
MSIVAIDIHPQQAFSELCPDELPIKGALSIVPHLNRQAAWADYRVLTKDAHPPGAAWHIKQPQPLQPLTQADLWVRHAVIGSKGFQSLPQLPDAHNYHFLVHIGMEQHAHTFGACFHDMAENISTGLVEWLQARDADTLIIGGLATEYCVQATVLQLCWYGSWNVIVNLSACRSMNAEEEQQAIDNMKKAGAIIARHTDDIPQLLAKHRQKVRSSEWSGYMNAQAV